MRKDELLREELASLCHDQWSNWMEHLFSKCEIGPNGTLIIPKWYADRWSGQMRTSFDGLSEPDKEKDRKEADRFLAIVNGGPPEYRLRDLRL